MKLDVTVQKEIKRALGKKAASLVQDDMLVGLGSGTTATYFIESLIERCRDENLRIQTVSSSLKSMEIASKGGISVIEMDSVTSIDLTIDGADEIDPQNRMIKGGGGAHVREKIVASSSKEVIIVIDESKQVEILGTFGLPIEVLRFGYKATISKINQQGYQGALRLNKDNSPYMTDNGNYIYDIHHPNNFKHPEEDNQRLMTIPGVVDTGFFFNIATRVLVGYADGNLEFRK